MSRVVHFEIHAENLERAVNFYTGLFGWTFQKWGDQPYWVIVTGPDGTPGINGGLMKRLGPAPADAEAVNAFVCSVQVASVDESVTKAIAAGGTVALPKMPIPTVGWLAYVKDTEGNILGLFQPDKSVK
jgi:predicted enzyme related to lactoylglutathione lyase